MPTMLEFLKAILPDQGKNCYVIRDSKGTRQAFAETIEKLSSEAPEVAAGVIELLTKANDALSKRLPMKPMGTGAGSGVDALDGAEAELEAEIQKRMGEVRKSAGNARYTREQAHMDVITSRPDLVAKLSEERQA